MSRIVEQECKGCGHRVDVAMALDGGYVPEPGDATVCCYCGTFMVFEEGLALRLMTEEDIAELEDGLRMDMVRMRRIILDRSA